MRADSVVGIHVLITHEPARLVCADGQESQVHRAEAGANLTEVFPVTGVAGEINLSRADLHDESAPERCDCGFRGPRVDQVLRRRHSDGGRRGIDGLPPVELINSAQPKAFEEGAVPKARDEVRRVHGFQSNQCFDIQVVVVIVRDEDHMNRRQIGKGLVPESRTRRGPRFRNGLARSE